MRIHGFFFTDSKKSLDESFRKALEERNKKDVDPTSITVSSKLQKNYIS